MMTAHRITACASAFLIVLSAGCGQDQGPGGPADGPATVVLTVDSAPPGAEIFMDGADAGRTTPDTLLINAGSHALVLRLCDYGEWTKSFESVDGDTLAADATLEKIFSFEDGFESGGGNWTAGCPFTFPDSGSFDGSAYALIVEESDCSTRLLTELDVPRCLTPHVSFDYKLTTTGLVAGNLRIDTGGGSEIVAVDTTSVWTHFEVPASTFDDLSGPATFTFVLSGNGVDSYRLSLDDFVLDAR